jgi:hypothetical protein
MQAIPSMSMTTLSLGADAASPVIGELTLS